MKPPSVLISPSVLKKIDKAHCFYYKIQVCESLKFITHNPFSSWDKEEMEGDLH